MRQDVLDAIALKMPRKVPCKEAMNNRELFLHGSGIDPETDIVTAFVKTAEVYGVDFLGGVPEQEGITRIRPGQTQQWGRQTVTAAPLGVFPTLSVSGYGFHTVEEVYGYEPETDDPVTAESTYLNYKAFYERSAALLGEIAVPYYLYYTVLFMWSVQTFGWELFMEAAMADPEAFDGLLEKFSRQTERHLEGWSRLGLPFIMVHDDIAMSTGPVFHPDWYDKYVFPRYRRMFAPLREKGVKVIFTSDGNIDRFIDPLCDCGVDGFMIETPATDFDNILRKCGKDKVIIGGIDTCKLTFGTPDEVYSHTEKIMKKGREYPGFFVSSPGGLHGNISWPNMEAYFAAKTRYGVR